MALSRVLVILVATAAIIVDMNADKVQRAQTITMLPLEPAQTGVMAQYQRVKSGLQEQKRAICSYLLNDLDNREDEKLDLDKVTHLFEASLDHVAKTTSYVTLMRPHINQESVDNFDTNGGRYVLEISNARRKLIEDYRNAETAGASEQQKRDLLEKYFFIACDFKLSTIVTEKAMYDTALKAEKQMRVQLFGGDAGN